ncbi:dihydrolipoyl dehydrogenase [uncultured Deefgea sp.]|uniref:dihydrolipoyl dehydrogenase n=1 Tax=uncultured Deefgea sp. TaxID=1304914 RepID=UPI002638C1E8|nr:dihydrolipoyl dehydrogenase [uncultured Deefgea sp.]
MSNTIELKVPDIGGHAGVDVIEVFVKVGDTVAVEDSLIALETDKATMEVPSTHAGVIKEMRLTAGSKASEGDVIAILEITASVAAPAATVSAAAPTPAVSVPAPTVAPVAGQYTGKVDIECDMLVVGAGPGGYSAAFRAADLGMKAVIVERYSTLGGVCLNVGCIPSKALLHNAAVIDEVSHMAKNGIKFGAPEIDIDALRGYKDQVINKLTGGLAGMAKMRKVEHVRGLGTFLDANHMEVQVTTGTGQALSGEKKVVKFAQAVIAAGSQAVKLPFIPNDPRIIDSTGALELKSVVKRMLIIGGGIIGLEMGTVYSTLGARLDVVELSDGLMQGADRDLVKVWQDWNKHRFDNIMLSSKTTSIVPKDDGVWVTFEGPNAPSDAQCYDLVLYSTGRSPNGKKVGAENAGVIVDERGFIVVDKQMRTNVANIFAIGDLVGQPMLAHKAVHEAHVAAENAAGHKAYFDARVIPGVAYTDPEVAWVGLTEDQAKKDGIKITKGVFPWAASGRAIANGRTEGFTKLIFDAENGLILGGAIVGPHAGDMIGEICLGIEMGADAVDIGKTIHPHPTMGESIGMAAEVAKGVCTDLPPQRKK